MTQIKIALLGSLLLTGLLMASGCSDPDPKPAGTAGGGGSGEGGGGGTGGSGGAPPLTCDKYCTDVEASCTTTNQQYPTKASCLGVCATFATGISGDKSGDSLACRGYHVSAAVAGPDLHCAHAGPGGDKTCGTSICSTFCAIATKVCSNEWKDLAACEASCGGWATSGMPYNTSDTDKNTVECRLYHLSVAASDANSAMMHCPHTITSSLACVN